MNNERRFVADAAAALAQLRGTPVAATEAPQDDRRPGALGPEAPGGLEEVLQLAEHVREDVVAVMAACTTPDLAAPLVWAGQQVDIRFMLHRRATHERQHTVQIRKVLQAIWFAQSEAQLILAEAEIARGAMEGLVLGLPGPLLDPHPGSGLPIIGELLLDAASEEEARVSAILKAAS
jgi:hypothetical protein